MSLELGRRIAFTLGALLVYRIGTYIPLPGIDIAVWSQIFGANRGGLIDLYNSASGGGAHRLAIFSLGIVPYITAAGLIQFAMIASSRLQALGQQGDRGRKKIVAYTRYLTLAIAAFQALGIAGALEGVHGVVTEPGALFKLSTVLTLTGGTMLLAWLADQITARGIGNGLALILAVGVAIELSSATASAFIEVARGTITPDMILATAILAAAFTALIALVEGARRRIAVDYPKREIGGRVVEGTSVPLALKLNNAGILPTLLANWFIVLPAVVASYVVGPGSAAGRAIFNQLNPARPLYMILFGILIVGLTLFYTAFLLDPERVSETLKTHGGAVRGVAPGEPTAAYFDDVVSRLTLVAGLYLVFVFIVPELLVVYFRVPVYLAGQSLLILVCATLDIGAQFKQQMQLQPGGYRR